MGTIDENLGVIAAGGFICLAGLLIIGLGAIVQSVAVENKRFVGQLIKWVGLGFTITANLFVSIATVILVVQGYWIALTLIHPILFVGAMIGTLILYVRKP